MFENTKTVRRVLAGVVGVNLSLALAVSAGAVPKPGDHGSVHTAAAAAAEPVAAPVAPQADNAAQDAVQPTVPTTAAPAPTTPAAPTTVAAPKVTTPPTTKAPAPKPAVTTAAPAPATAAPAVTVPAVPVTVPRRVPSAAEVQAAIAALPQYVRTPFTPTAAQVAQIGDQVCSAFDQGQTFAQVKATGLSMVTQIPLTTILPGGADWVVKTVVNLYCPGYASKLV